jgi:hypothetical protein
VELYLCLEFILEVEQLSLLDALVLDHLKVRRVLEHFNIRFLLSSLRHSIQLSFRLHPGDTQEIVLALLLGREVKVAVILLRVVIELVVDDELAHSFSDISLRVLEDVEDDEDDINLAESHREESHNVLETLLIRIEFLETNSACIFEFIDELLLACDLLVAQLLADAFDFPRVDLAILRVGILDELDGDIRVFLQ